MASKELNIEIRAIADIAALDKAQKAMDRLADSAARAQNIINVPVSAPAVPITDSPANKAAEAQAKKTQDFLAKVARGNEELMRNSAKAVDPLTEATNLFRKAMAPAYGALLTFNQGLMLVKTAIDAVQGAWNAYLDSLRNAVRLGAAREEFMKMNRAIGQSGETILATLRSVSQGVLTESQMMENANLLLAGQFDVTQESMTTLFNIAERGARRMGTDVDTAFKDLVKGVARGSTKILDNLGIIIKQNQAVSEYARILGVAESQLTETQRSQAIFNAVLDEGKQAGLDQAQTYSRSYQALKEYDATLQSFSDTWTVFWAESEAGVGALENITGGLRSISEAFQDVLVGVEAMSVLLERLGEIDLSGDNVQNWSTDTERALRSAAAAAQAMRGEFSARTFEGSVGAIGNAFDDVDQKIEDFTLTLGDAAGMTGDLFKRLFGSAMIGGFATMPATISGFMSTVSEEVKNGALTVEQATAQVFEQLTPVIEDQLNTMADMIPESMAGTAGELRQEIINFNEELKSGELSFEETQQGYESISNQFKDIQIALPQVNVEDYDFFAQQIQDAIIAGTDNTEGGLAELADSIGTQLDIIVESNRVGFNDLSADYINQFKLLQMQIENGTIGLGAANAKWQSLILEFYQEILPEISTVRDAPTAIQTTIRDLNVMFSTYVGGAEEIKRSLSEIADSYLFGDIEKPEALDLLTSSIEDLGKALNLDDSQLNALQPILDEFTAGNIGISTAVDQITDSISTMAGGLDNINVNLIKSELLNFGENALENVPELERFSALFEDLNDQLRTGEITAVDYQEQLNKMLTDIDSGNIKELLNALLELDTALPGISQLEEQLRTLAEQGADAPMVLRELGAVTQDIIDSVPDKSPYKEYMESLLEDFLAGEVAIDDFINQVGEMEKAVVNGFDPEAVDLFTQAVNEDLTELTEDTLPAAIAAFNDFVTEASLSGAGHVEIYENLVQSIRDYGNTLSADNPFRPFFTDLVRDATESRMPLSDLRNSFQDLIETVEGGDISQFVDMQLAYLDDMAQELEDSFDERADLYADYDDEILKLQEDYQDDLKKAEQDLQDELDDIVKDGADKRGDIWDKYYEKLGDNASKASKSISDAELKFNRTIEDLRGDTTDKQAAAADDAADKIYDIQAQLQEDLLALEQESARDVQEAIRKRDARALWQALQNLEDRKSELINNAQKEEDAVNAERRDAQDEAQADLENAIAEAETTRRRAIEDTLTDQREADEEAANQRNKDLSDLEQNLREQEQEARDSYAKQIADLTEAFNEREGELDGALNDELNRWKEHYDELEKEMTDRANEMQAIQNASVSKYGVPKEEMPIAKRVTDVRSVSDVGGYTFSPTVDMSSITGTTKDAATSVQASMSDIVSAYAEGSTQSAMVMLDGYRQRLLNQRESLDREIMQVQQSMDDRLITVQDGARRITEINQQKNNILEDLQRANQMNIHNLAQQQIAQTVADEQAAGQALIQQKQLTNVALQTAQYDQIQQERAINMQSLAQQREVTQQKVDTTQWGVTLENKALSEGFTLQQKAAVRGTQAIIDVDKGSWFERVTSTVQGMVQQAAAQQVGVSNALIIQQEGQAAAEISETESLTRRSETMTDFVEKRQLANEAIIKSLESQVNASNKLRQADAKNLGSYLKAVTDVERQSYQNRIVMLDSTLIKMATMRNASFNAELTATISHHRTIESEYARHIATLSNYASQASRYASSVSSSLSSANSSLSSLTAKSSLASKQFSTVNSDTSQAVTYSTFSKTVSDLSTLTTSTKWR